MIKKLVYLINNLTKRYRKKTLVSISINFDEIDVIPKSKKILSENGIVVIKNVFNEDVIDGSLNEVNELILRKAEEIFSNNNYFENDSFAFQKNMVKLKSYKELNDYHLPVVNMRSDNLSEPDGGMIDVFNVNKVHNFQEITNLCEINKLIRTDKTLHEILSGFIRANEKSSTHVYINKGVTNPRPIHFDNLDTIYKVFVYLTDVNELGDGLYSYVPGSHKTDGFIRRTHKLNKLFKHVSGDMPFFRAGSALPILGPKGTVVISCQNGLHGGVPQVGNSLRVVYVDTFL